LGLARALARTGENSYACRLAERAVSLIGPGNSTLLSNAAIALARAGAVTRAEEIARTLSSWSDRGQAIEAVVTALAAAGDFSRAQSVAQDMADKSHKASALSAIASVMAHTDADDQGSTVYDGENASALRAIDNAAGWLKAIGEKAVAKQLLADAEARADSVPWSDRPSMQQLIARALCHIGSYWEHLLTDLARIDPAAVHTVADVIAPHTFISDPAGANTTPSRE
jgi:hypothetical protein